MVVRLLVAANQLVCFLSRRKQQIKISTTKFEVHSLACPPSIRAFGSSPLPLGVILSTSSAKRVCHYSLVANSYAEQQVSFWHGLTAKMHAECSNLS